MNGDKLAWIDCEGNILQRIDAHITTGHERLADILNLDERRARSEGSVRSEIAPV